MKALLAIAVSAAVLALLPECAFGQRLSLGLIGGSGLTSDFRNTTSAPGFGESISSAQQWYIVGAKLDVHLPLPVDMEVDGLYRPLGLIFAIVNPDGSLSGHAHNTVVTWEFPVLAKYRLPNPLGLKTITPFLEAGPAFRLTGNLNGTNPSHLGIAAGVGFRVPFGNWRLEPGFRYIRWDADPARQYVRTVQDQAEILVGLTKETPRERGAVRRAHIGFALGGTLTADFPQSTFPLVLITNNQQHPGTGIDSAGPRSLVGGAVGSLDVYKSLSVEADAFVRVWHQSEQWVFSDGTPSQSHSASFSTWEFPVVARYALPALGLQRFFRPVLEAGPAFRIRGDLSGAGHYGITAGAGVEFRWHKIRITPRLRYTNWGSDNPLGGSYLATQNEAALMTALSF